MMRDTIIKVSGGIIALIGIAVLNPIWFPLNAQTTVGLALFIIGLILIGIGYKMPAVEEIY